MESSKNPESLKLKKLLSKYVSEANNDFNYHLLDDDSTVFTKDEYVEVIKKYRDMLININEVCKERNRF